MALFVYLPQVQGWMNYYTLSIVFFFGVLLRIVAYYRKWSILLV